MIRRAVLVVVVALAAAGCVSVPPPDVPDVSTCEVEPESDACGQ